MDKKVFKPDSAIEIALREVESVMHKYNMRLEFRGYDTIITVGNQSGFIRDVSNDENSFCLPRSVEEERIVCDPEKMSALNWT